MDLFPSVITHAYIMLTEQCPCRCTYCWVKDRSNPLTITKEQIKILTERFNVPHPLLIFFGGEPLLHLDLIKDTVEKYKDKCNFQIITSGVVNFDSFMDEIYSNNRDQISVLLSWDGKQADSRVLLSGEVKGKDIYNTLIRNLDKGYRIETHGVISDTNIDNWYNMHMDIRELRRKYSNVFNDYQLAHQSSFNKKFYDKFDYQMKLIFNQIKKDLVIDPKTTFISQWFLQNIYNILTESTGLSCDSGNYVCMRPNGDLYTCTILSQYGSDFCLGNIKDNKLNNDILQKLGPNSKCNKSCLFKSICDGGCRYERVENFNKKWEGKICKHTCKIKKIIQDNTIKFINDLDDNLKQYIIDLSIRWANWFTEYHKNMQESRKMKVY